MKDLLVGVLGFVFMLLVFLAGFVVIGIFIKELFG